MSKTLIERGKEVAAKMYPETSYADLPSKTLTTLGKEALTTDNSVTKKSM